MCKGWSDIQKSIYAGLKDIGGEAAGYFKSALTYYYDSSLSNRVSHLAHDAREIDGGLRDIFSPEKLKKKTEKELILKDITKIFGNESKEYKGHIASILVALDVEEKDEFAKEWWSVATNFARYAHRNGIWKNERSFEEFKPLWERYEKVLFKLVGSYYAIIARIDHLINLGEITYESEGLLLNLLKQSPYFEYFFRNINNIKWFDFLKKYGYFSPEQIKHDDQNNVIFWSPLIYLEKISKESTCGKELIEIVNNLVFFSLEDNSANRRKNSDYRIWWYCVKILNNLPAAAIKVFLPVDNFKTWLLVWTDSSLGGDLAISDIGEDLLPKFLQDDFGPDHSYAEAIVEAITAIKIGGKPHSLAKREDVVLNWGTYWVLDAFRKHATLIGQKCSRSLILGIADKLRKVLEYGHQDYHVDVNMGSDIYRVALSRVNLDEPKYSGISFKENEYRCVIKQFSAEQIKEPDLKKDLWERYNIEPKIDIVNFTFVALTEDSFAAEIKKQLPAGVDWQNTVDFKNRLALMYRGFYADYSQIWCKSLAVGGEHDTYSSTEEILTVILRDVLLAKCDKNSADGLEILKIFLTDKYRFPIFKRFVLLCIDKYWEKYPGLLEEFFSLIPKALDESDFEVELQDIFKKHNASFSSEFNAKLLALINQPPEFILEEKDKREIAPYWWKFRWLSPLRENPYFSALYEETKQKVQPQDGKPYEPERSSSFKGGIVTHKSSITKEEFLQKPIDEIIHSLANFKDVDFWPGSFEGKPDKEGLANALQEAVKENSKKFTNELFKFKSVKYYYLYHIIRGLEGAWNTEKPLDWSTIFDFILEYFNRDKDLIIKEATEGQGGNTSEGRYLRIVEAVVELISDGSKADARAFAPEYFDKVEQIFDLIIPLLKGDEHPSNSSRGTVNYALNTTLGRAIMAYITFSLRVARATQKRIKDWGKGKFERFLPIGVDGFVWFGFHLPQMKYLDSDYTVEKIKDFAEKDSNDSVWQMFMEGYLTGAQIYDDLYKLMRKNYEKAIQSTVFKGRVDDRLVEHVCVGYLYLNETLTDKNSLFWKILDESDTVDKRGRWKDIARFFWRKSKQWEKQEKVGEDAEKLKSIQKKIVDFWSWTVEEQDFVKSKLGEDYEAFLSQMAFLTVWLDKIDDNSEKLLMQSAPYIDIDHSSGFFIEYLTKFEDQESRKRIGKIFKKVLETSTPMFKEEEVILLVERLYELGKTYPQSKSDADDICNTYGKRGVHFLRETFFKNNK